MKIRLTLAALGCLAGCAVYFLVTSLADRDRRLDTERPATDEQILEAATVAIASVGAGTTHDAVVQAAPSPQRAAAPLRRMKEKAPPAPPEGFSFAGIDDQTKQGRVATPAEDLKDVGDDGLSWLGTPSSMEALAIQAASAGRGWSFGWIRLAEGAILGEIAPQLEKLGGRVVGSAGDLVRAMLPGDIPRLEAMDKLEGVRGLGALPPREKLPPGFSGEVQVKPLSEQIPVFITLMTGDPDGKWRGALEAMGAVVGRFDPEIRVYAANVTPDVVERLATADFVLAIEPVGIVKAAHDTAVPAMGVDDLRIYSGSPGLFTGIGGASTPIGVMDTGLNINHLDIASHRESICGANFVYFNPLFDDQDLWVDQFGHGTHVTGTIAGNGYVEARYAGMAPSVGHIRFAKVLSHNGTGNETFILRGMDFLSRTSACPEAGWTDTRVKPLIVNTSLSRTGLTFAGRGAAARKLDSIVWSQGQLYVVAQSNAGIHGFSNYGAAKNSLSVGAAYDDGSLATFSSHGPTADGRLLPQVVGTGVGVYSAAGDASRSGYRILQWHEHVLARGRRRGRPDDGCGRRLSRQAVP